MTQITSHILDTSIGKPAQGVLISLMQQQGDNWLPLGSGETNADGRVADFTGLGGMEGGVAGSMPSDVLPAGIYKLTFYLSHYYEQTKRSSFYPHVDITFEIEGDGQHYHVPLLLNPYGYSTYRGS